jgi:predicted DNA-binding protein YlxM (UPF0122 family)
MEEIMKEYKPPTKEELNKYYSLGYSMKEIAEYLDVAVGTIYNYFKKYNIKPRPQMSDLTKAKISKANKGKTSPRKGVILTDEIKEKMSINRSTGVGKKTIKNGYVRIYFPDHPKSDKYGYIFEHDLIMECNIGRWLKPDEVVHHINGIRNDNRIKNLKLMTRGEHSRLHNTKKED